MADFKLHSIDSAPEASKPFFEVAQKAIGFVPNLHRVLAESRSLMRGYLTLAGIFEKSSLSTVEQHVVYLTSNFENGCHYCMAGHTGLAKAAGVPGDVISAIRDGTPIADPKLQALRQLVSQVVTQRGRITAENVDAFIAAGYSNEAVLDVILGVAVKVMSNYTNLIASTPVDDVMQRHSWTHPRNR